MLLKRLPLLSVVYLAVLIVCCISIFRLVDAFGKSQEQYQQTVSRSMNIQKILTRLSFIASEIQGSKSRILFNNEPDDVASETENIDKLVMTFDQELKALQPFYSDHSNSGLYDSLVSIAAQNDALKQSVFVPDNYRAIELFYTYTLPAYNKLQFQILSMVDENSSALESNIQQADDMIIEKDKNVIIWLSLCIVAVATGLVTVIIRESRRLRKEQTLKKQFEEEQVENLRRDIRGQEQDRNILGAELHDNINQQLALVKLKLSMALQEPEKSDDIISKSIRHVNDLIEEIRLISRTLVNPMAKNLTLKDSITELVQSLEDLLPRIEFNLYIEEADEEKYISPEIKVNIFRIVQEQINNIVKHADATVVNIYLTYDAGELRLTIEDNGVGFDPNKRGVGVGLNSIQQRAKAFQGAAEIDSSAGKGCILSVTFPAV